LKFVFDNQDAHALLLFPVPDELYLNGRFMACSGGLVYAGPMSRGLTRFVLVAIAIATVAAVVIHLFAPDAMRALGRSLHGG
jgi:hypothetical protein